MNKSLIKFQNYGNEKDVFDLLYPNPHAVRGIDDPDFEELIDQDQLRSMLLNNNYSFQDAEYNIIYALTLRNSPHVSGKVSYKAFVNAMRHLKKEYMNYRTLIS